MSEPITNLPEKKPGGPPTFQVGRQGQHIVIAIGGKPLAFMTPPEAMVLAAMLVKPAFVISSGIEMVDDAIKKTFEDTKILPVHIIDGKPRPNPPATGS